MLALALAPGCDTAEVALPSTASSPLPLNAAQTDAVVAQVETQVDESAASEPSAPAAPPSPSPATNDRLLPKTFDDIKFDIEPDAPFDRGMLTDEIEQLDGSRIRIRGYIYPTPQKRGIKQFVLVRDNQECCFGPGAALYDCILVEMKPGQTAEFSNRPVAVEGDFRIEEFLGPAGRPLAIYRLAGEKVER